MPILSVPEITFYSLQKGTRRDDLTDLPCHVQMQDLAPRLGDFGDLAVIIDQLDLVISVDSSVGPYGRRLGEKSLDTAESWCGLALDVRGGDHAVVSDDAPVSPDKAW